MTDVRRAIKFSMHNHDACKNAARCGCFSCTRIFPTSEIVEYWCGGNEKDTAVCPHCGIDTVIPEAPDFVLTSELLMKMKHYWFGKDR